MNTRQLEYAIALSKTRNFSQASEMFDISQPALSKQILNLEKELGIKLFDRNTVPFTMTPAGEYFIQEAERLLYQESQLLHALEQYKSGEKGRLDIGISPFRNLYMMPAIIKKFKERYPGVQVVLHETSSDQLRKNAAEGKYDLAVVNLPVDVSVLNVTLLEQEYLVLAVPRNLLSCIEGGIPTDNSLDFSACKALPFVVVAQSQEMRRYFDSMCASCDIKPDIALEVAGGVTTAWSMARAGIGATLLPLQFLENEDFDDALSLFTLKDCAFTRQTAIVTRRGQYISDYARYMTELLTTHTSKDQF